MSLSLPLQYFKNILKIIIFGKYKQKIKNMEIKKRISVSRKSIRALMKEFNKSESGIYYALRCISDTEVNRAIRAKAISDYGGQEIITRTII